MKHVVAPVLPCNNIDRTQAFYEKIGFRCYACYDNYRLLVDERGAELHLTIATEELAEPRQQSLRNLLLHRGCGRPGLDLRQSGHLPPGAQAMGHL